MTLFARISGSLALLCSLALTALPALAGDIFGYDPDTPAPQAAAPQQEDADSSASASDSGSGLPSYLRMDPEAEPAQPEQPGFSELCEQCRQLSKDLRAMAQEDDATAHDLHGLTAAAMEQAARFLCVLDAFADVASDSVGPLLDMALERTGLALAEMKQFLENEVFTEELRQRLLAFFNDASLALKSYTWKPEGLEPGEETPDDRRPRAEPPQTIR